MAQDDGNGRGHERWAHLRFSVVGPLLAAPPARGELREALEALAKKEWRHPITGAPVRFSVPTIERWLYRARNAGHDPVGVLRRKIRKDLGKQTAVGDKLAQALVVQYQQHKSWSAQLHRDNLAVLVEEDKNLGPMPSYSSVRRFLKTKGLVRRRRLRPDRPGEARAEAHVESREVRSYEAEHVHGLWHSDFHVGSLPIVLADGRRVRPLLLGVLDDRSRLICHVQWYLAETAESFVHGLCQAIQKRGLPRALLTDNGSAMRADETQQGLARLGVISDTTLPNSPYMNAKMEVFWAQVEGRLMAMLENQADLTLALLNEATQAWAELEYNVEVHTETNQTPLRRLLDGPDVGRPSPSSEDLRRAFLAEVRRMQRKSDGTLTLGGIRFEIPGRFRHLDRLAVRYASWDLAHVLLVDERTGALLCPIYPLDRAANADGRRRALDLPWTEPAPAKTGMAPLLKKLMARYAATGLPPAYLPKEEKPS
jgi:transposase InsO family protein